MIRRSLARLARMDARRDRLARHEAARIADRSRARRGGAAAWNRAPICCRRSAPTPRARRSRARAGRTATGTTRTASWRAISSAAPQRFVDRPADQGRARRAHPSRRFPDAARHAAARADRILAGEYDLLGYRGTPIRPAARTCACRRLPDWHCDPVHDRRAPQRFWSTVPYLDPACGDHKIIWELNRHQHWLALGRAFWLTGDAPVSRPRRSPSSRAGSTRTRRSSASTGRACWSSRSDRSRGSGRSTCSPIRPPDRRATPWLVDLLLALDRQLAHVEHNLSYYFSPNTHLLGEALALYVAGRTLPELAASPRREALGRRILLARDRSADRAPTAATASGRPTITATRSTSICSRWPSRASPAIDVARDASSLPSRASASAARLLADDSGRLPHIGDDDGGALLPIAGRAPDDMRDSLSIAAALIGRPELRVGAAAGRSVLAARASALASSLMLTRSPLSARLPSAALPDTGYYVSRSPAGDHLVIDGGPHGYQNAGHAHADALSLTFARARRAAPHRSGHRLLHGRSRAARPVALDGAAQHARCRRSAAVDAARTVSLGARRQARGTPWRTNALRLFRRRARRLPRSSTGAACWRCTAISSSLPISSPATAAMRAAVHWHIDPAGTSRARSSAVARRADN